MEIATYLTSGSTVAARPGEEIEIVGKGFGRSGNIQVKWECVELPVLERSDTRLKVHIPTSITPPDAAQILVVRPREQILGPPLAVVGKTAGGTPEPPPEPPVPPPDVSISLPILPELLRVSTFDSIGNHTAAHGVDGHADTYWLTSSEERGKLHWIEVNFREEHRIDKVRFSLVNYERRSYICSISAGSHLLVPRFFSRRGKEWEEKEFSSVSTKQVTLSILDTSRWVPRYRQVGLYELQIWGIPKSGDVTPSPPPPPPVTDVHQKVIDLTNEERRRAGLIGLISNFSLAAAAQGHAEDMSENNYFSHISLDGRSMVDRIREAGYRFRTVGENIARGYSTPERVIEAWMDSPGHRRNILNPDFMEIGVGYVEGLGRGVNYWVQNFGKSL